MIRTAQPVISGEGIAESAAHRAMAAQGLTPSAPGEGSLTNETGPTTVWTASLNLVRHPVRELLWRWNWKSALLSSLLRATIFFLANLVAGWPAAAGAGTAELVLRSVTSGFYGAVTEALSAAQPAWAAMTVAMVGVPILSHSIEFFVHWLRGTPKLAASMAISVGFTAISSAFNLYVMRQGVLTVGPTAKPLLEDLSRIPSLLVSFVASGPRAATGRVLRSRSRPGGGSH